MLITELSAINQYQTTRTAWENNGPRNTHYLAYQVLGRYDHTVNGKVLAAAKDCLLFINQKDAYSVKCKEQGYSICISFRAKTNLSTSVWDMRNNSIVYNLFLRLLQLKNLTNKSNYYLAMSILYEIFSILSKPQQTLSPTTPSINNIEFTTDYISERLANGEIKTAELAKLCGISEKYFRTLFKKRFGVTPTQYIIEQRLEKAAKLLDFGGFTVAEISESVGIFDVYYFSKLFKRHFGVSPSKYITNK